MWRQKIVTASSQDIASFQLRRLWTIPLSADRGGAIMRSHIPWIRILGATALVFALGVVSARSSTVGIAGTPVDGLYFDFQLSPSSVLSTRDVDFHDFELTDVPGGIDASIFADNHLMSTADAAAIGSGVGSGYDFFRLSSPALFSGPTLIPAAER
jgi:hypothetical protein